jgi:hypothetical protein
MEKEGSWSPNLYLAKKKAKFSLTPQQKGRKAAAATTSQVN